jgi:hypothetical protein
MFVPRIDEALAKAVTHFLNNVFHRIAHDIAALTNCNQ